MNIAVIGIGYWGPNLVRNFNQMYDVNVSYLCDLNQESLTRMKKIYSFAKTTQDYREILKDPSVNAVAIATPASSHYKIAKDALEAGKHVLLEKPMAESAKECEDLIRIAEENDLTLQIDHTYIYTGAVRKIKELLDNNELGETLYFDSVRVNLGLFQHDVNVIWDLAPHDLSIMDYLLGNNAVAVSASGLSCFNSNLESLAYITIYFASGRIAHFHLNWLSPVKIRRILIGGSKKMLVFDDLEASEKIKVYDKGVSIQNGDVDGIYKTLVQYRTGDMWAPQIDQTEALKYECRHFIDCIETKSRPMTDGRMGLRVVKLLKAINTSILNDGRKVYLSSGGNNELSSNILVRNILSEDGSSVGYFREDSQMETVMVSKPAGPELNGIRMDN